uniref:SAP domain-containing protein n=1 Tax=viral metagenome TaxID=1070528 RepID=A0A6C0EQQ7_9ZZZZ
MAIQNKKYNAESLDLYMKSISTKIQQKIDYQNKKIKLNDLDDKQIPSIKTYNNIITYNYSIPQLKNIAKHYKLKVGGNKKELIDKIYNFLSLSSYIIKIQKMFRLFLIRKYNILHGPAIIKRNLCTNNSDFISMESIEDINFHQFISYKDIDNFIYGFDMGSLHNLILKSGKDIKNPYNRNVIPDYVLSNINSILRIGKLLNIYINLNIEDDTLNISNEKVIELRTLALFQNIDALGNYSNPQWFLSLNRSQIIKFIRELSDIWNYRAQLAVEVKLNICPPSGDPFRNLNMQFIHTEANMLIVKKVVLEVLEKLVNFGVDKDSKALGAYYVLGALTLVNENAATSLPWLFQSVSYF